MGGNREEEHYIPTEDWQGYDPEWYRHRVLEARDRHGRQWKEAELAKQMGLVQERKPAQSWQVYRHLQGYVNAWLDMESERSGTEREAAVQETGNPNYPRTPEHVLYERLKDVEISDIGRGWDKLSQDTMQRGRLAYGIIAFPRLCHGYEKVALQGEVRTVQQGWRMHHLVEVEGIWLPPHQLRFAQQWASRVGIPYHPRTSADGSLLIPFRPTLEADPQLRTRS